MPEKGYTSRGGSISSARGLTRVKFISVSGNGLNKINILCNAPAFFSNLENRIFHRVAVPSGGLMPLRRSVPWYR